MASAIRDLPETRASCCSNHLLSSSTRGLLCSWRRRDALEGFACDRSGAVLGDIEEPASQVGPAESERDRLAACYVGNALVGGISVALHDAAIVLEQLEGVDRAAPRTVGVGAGGGV